MEAAAFDSGPGYKPLGPYRFTGGYGSDNKPSQTTAVTAAEGRPGAVLARGHDAPRGGYGGRGGRYGGRGGGHGGRGGTAGFRGGGSRGGADTQVAVATELRDELRDLQRKANELSRAAERALERLEKVVTESETQGQDLKSQIEILRIENERLRSRLATAERKVAQCKRALEDKE